MQPQKQAENQSPKKKTSLTVQDFTLKHKLGKGAYGDVFLVSKNSDGKIYAMKQIQKKKLAREEKQYQAMVEKELLSQLKHNGIIKLKYTFQDKANLYFIQEYCEGGEFINFIKVNIGKLTEELKVFYIAEIINILEYLHTNGITHRDLKPENLMLDRRGHLKLIDFGTAEITNCKLLTAQFKEHILKLKKKSEELSQPEKEVELDDLQAVTLKKRRSTFVGTCYYISPQLLEHNYCPPSADLWALGCIIYQLYYLQTPFKDNYEFAVFEKIKKAEVTYAKNELITDDAIDLIKKLLIKDPHERLGSCTRQQLSFSQLKAHPYFKGLDIDSIFHRNVPFIADLQQPEKSQQEKKETEQRFLQFKEKSADLLNSIRSEGKVVTKWGIVQEKSFIFFSFALLVLCSDKDLILISSQQGHQHKHLKLRGKGSESVKLLSETGFQLFQQERGFHFRCGNAGEWVSAIESEL